MLEALVGRSLFHCALVDVVEGCDNILIVSLFFLEDELEVQNFSLSPKNFDIVLILFRGFRIGDSHRKGSARVS